MLFSYEIFRRVLDGTEEETVFSITLKPSEEMFYRTYISGVWNPDTECVDFYLANEGTGLWKFAVDGSTLLTNVMFDRELHSYMAMASEYLERYVGEYGSDIGYCTDLCRFDNYAPRYARANLSNHLEYQLRDLPYTDLTGVVATLELGFVKIDWIFSEELDSQNMHPHGLYLQVHTGLCWQDYGCIEECPTDMPGDKYCLVSILQEKLIKYCRDYGIDYNSWR